MHVHCLYKPILHVWSRDIVLGVVKSFDFLEFVNTTEETNITNNDMAVFFCIITLVENSRCDYEDIEGE